MYTSDFLKNYGSFLKNIKNLQTMQDTIMTATQTLLSNQTYLYQPTTGTDGTVTVDYSSLKLSKAPGVVVMIRLGINDAPVLFDIVGDPTATSAKIRLRRPSSIVGLLPTYIVAAGVKLDVFVRPVA